MKKLFFIAFLCSISGAYSQGSVDFFNRADLFFKMYTKDGLVNYKALKENSSDLDWLTNFIATEEYDKHVEKAYLINVYNLSVISQIVHYPTLVKDPNTISGFFNNKGVQLAGEKVSLNEIENEMIRPVYKDPRMHFVLVCGAIGCPPIADFAYRPEKLEEQLEQQTILALNNNAFVYDDAAKKIVFISQIFEWYSTDFGESYENMISFINFYRVPPFNDNFKVKFYPYNWSVNNSAFEIIPVENEDVKPTISFDSSATNNAHIALNENDSMVTDVPTNLFIDETDKIDAPSEIVNLQTFTAGSLLGKGKADLTLFNTLYTENHQNWKGQNFSGYRATFVTHLFQFTIGAAQSKRINLGFDLNFRYSGLSNEIGRKGINRAFEFANSDSSRVGLTAFGIRLKVQPFKAVHNFSIQSTLSIPTVKHPEGFSSSFPENNLYWADWDRITWWNQLFLDKTFGKFQLFTEIDFLFRFKKYESQIGMLDIPMSVFFSYFPTKKITLYAMSQHVPRLTNNINGYDPVVTDWVIPMNYTASGIGFKYQFLPNLNVELLYTNFWRGKNSGLGETFNIGIKFLTK